MKKEVTNEELFKQFKQLLYAWNSGPTLRAVSSITPDASLRRYYRLELDGFDRESVVAMVFDSLASPEHSGTQSVNSEEAYVALTTALGSAGVLVPELYYRSIESKTLIIEDIGDRHLADLLQESGRQTAATDATTVEERYRSAIDQIFSLQKLPREQGFFAFERAFTAVQYAVEMSELKDFSLNSAELSAGLTDSEIQLVDSSFELLSTELASLPKVLVHRDFHSWNLMLDSENRVRVIDFQDALCATETYDVVALLNDRDTDSLLGKDMYQSLLSYYFEQSSDGERLALQYPKVLLQRDCKVAGRFAKLSQLRGLKHYEQWIPGTLRRIGRSLANLEENGDRRFLDFAELLAEKLPEVSLGLAERKR